MNEQLVNIICMKWGDKYGSEYVNTLFNMVKRNLTIPFRFICLTDNINGILSEVEIKPIPKINFIEFDEMYDWSKGNGWLKLCCFANPLHDIQGRTLFLDLDIVITKNINSFFTYSDPFVVIRDWSMTDGTGNTSVFLFSANELNDILSNFISNSSAERLKNRNEQEYICRFLIDQSKIQYWPDAWCVSFKKHCLPKGIKRWFVNSRVPDDAKIIIFHGEPNPPYAILGKSTKWYKKFKPALWIKDYWF